RDVSPDFVAVRVGCLPLQDPLAPRGSSRPLEFAFPLPPGAHVLLALTSPRAVAGWPNPPDDRRASSPPHPSPPRPRLRLDVVNLGDDCVAGDWHQNAPTCHSGDDFQRGRRHMTALAPGLPPALPAASAPGCPQRFWPAATLQTAPRAK